MSKAQRNRELTYQARARIADNLFLQRRRAELSQGELAELAMVSASQIGNLENGKVAGMFDTYVRLAGSLSITLNDLLAGVVWVPGQIEFEIEASYEVKFGSGTFSSPASEEASHRRPGRGRTPHAPERPGR
jgi:transcriptional regulator with XRE-family HTH domain